jgi:hypothetical protein
VGHAKAAAARRLEQRESLDRTPRQSRRRPFRQRQYPIQRAVRSAVVHNPFVVVSHACALGRAGGAKPRWQEAGAVSVTAKAHENCVKHEPNNAIGPNDA